MKSSKSIRTRLVKNFMLIIVITVLTLQIVLTRGIKKYYYNNLEDVMTSQIQYSTDFYSRYFSTFEIEDIILDDIDLFWKYTKAQVQILNMDGELLMDSLGVSYDGKIETSDVISAQKLEKGTWKGNVEYSDEPVMAISIPLINNSEPKGIIRFISSLEETNSRIKSINFVLNAMGLVVIILSGIVSLFLANSIVKPLIEVTEVAEKLADGQYKVRSTVELEDEIGRLSNTLNHMAEEILKREQIKNDFISSISHELRTPLTSIKGWAITLKADDIRDDDLLKDGLNIIENESDRLTKMVEDLLDFSRFISGRITLEKEVFSLRDTMNMIFKQYSPRAKNKDINIDLYIGEDVDTITADQDRIKQVLINLVDNAIKFTPENGVIKLQTYTVEDNIVVVVEDNGVGIDEEDIPRIKEKFYRGKNKNANSGIGLSICDEIMSLHGGSLEIESEKDVGTKVKAILPLKEDK